MKHSVYVWIVNPGSSPWSPLPVALCIGLLGNGYSTRDNFSNVCAALGMSLSFTSVSLARRSSLPVALARPSLNEIALGRDSDDDDSCVAALCNNLALESLNLDGLLAVTPAIVDVILQSKAAMTLNFVSIFEVGLDYSVFTSASLLRLVRGCPKLCSVGWDVNTKPRWSAWRDGDNADELNELLKNRCLAHPDPEWRTFDEETDGFGFREYGPKTRQDTLPYRCDPEFSARYNGPSVLKLPAAATGPNRRVRIKT